MKTKILWLDTETTGTDPSLHSIIEIAGIIDIDGVLEKEFSYKVQPHKDFEIDEEALSVSKTKKSELKNYPDIPTVHSSLKKNFCEFVDPYKKEDKFIIAGQKISFDLNFLSHFFMRQNDNFLGSYIDFRKRIELLDITRGLRALGIIESQDSKLETLCKEFGVEIKAHNALSDIKATRELYYIFKNGINFKVER